VFEQPQAVYAQLTPDHNVYRRGASHYYVGSKGAVVYLHWDPEYNHNLHTVLAGKKRIILYTADQSRHLYQMPGTGKLSAIGTALAQADFSLFPALRFARGYDVTLVAGEAVYMPAMCWHYMEYLEPSVAQTCAFWPSLLEYRAATLQQAACRALWGDEKLHNLAVSLTTRLFGGNFGLPRALMSVACLRAAFPDCAVVGEFYEKHLPLEANPAFKPAESAST